MENIASLFLNTVFLLALEILGNFLLLCQIYYERFVMDPQKRTISNQLFSGLCLSAILHNIFIIPAYFIRLTGFLQRDLVDAWINIGTTGFLLYVIFTITEMTVVKIIYIKYFHKIAILDEYFISTFLNLINLIFVIICLAVRIHFDVHKETGYHQEQVIFWSSWFPALVCIGLILIITIIICIHKKKANAIEPEIELGHLPIDNEVQVNQNQIDNEVQVHQNQINNVSHNENIVSLLGIFCLTAAFFIFIFPTLAKLFFGLQNSNQEFQFYYYCVSCIGQSILFFAKTPRRFLMVLQDFGLN